MDNICTCRNCDYSFRYCLENLNFWEFKRDLKLYCSKCTNPNCLNHEVYKYLQEKFPNDTYTLSYLCDESKFPKRLRPGICNYLYQKYYWE